MDITHGFYHSDRQYVGTATEGMVGSEQKDLHNIYFRNKYHHYFRTSGRLRKFNLINYVKDKL